MPGTGPSNFLAPCARFFSLTLDLFLLAGYGGALGAFFGDELTNLTEAGTFSRERLADMALRTLTPHFALGQDTDDYPEVSFDQGSFAREGPYGPNLVRLPLLVPDGRTDRLTVSPLPRTCSASTCRRTTGRSSARSARSPRREPPFPQPSLLARS